MDTSIVEAGVERLGHRKRPRRLRTLQEKLRMVAETNVPGASVAEVARRHGVNANLLFGWRRQQQYGVLERRTRRPAVKLLPVQVSESQKAQEPQELAEAARKADEGRIEIILSKNRDIRIALVGAVVLERIEAIITMLRHSI